MKEFNDVTELGCAKERTLGYTGNHCEKNTWQPCAPMTDCDDKQCG